MFNGRITSIEYKDNRSGESPYWTEIPDSFNVMLRYRRRVRTYTASRANTTSTGFTSDPVYPEIRGHYLDGKIYTHDFSFCTVLADLVPYFGWLDIDSFGYSQNEYETLFEEFPQLRWTFLDWSRHAWQFTTRYTIFCADTFGGAKHQSPIAFKNDRPVNEIGFVIPIQSGIQERQEGAPVNPLRNFISLERIY